MTPTLDAEVTEQELGDRRHVHPSWDPERLTVRSSLEEVGFLPEQCFDDLARLASLLCHTGAALIWLATSGRSFVKAAVGLDHQPPPLDLPLVAGSRESADLVVVPDLSIDLAGQASQLKFYASAPVSTPEGQILGRLCVFDPDPRPAGLSDVEATSLEALARQVAALIEGRRAAAERDAAGTAQKQMTAQQAALMETQDLITDAKGSLEGTLDALVAGAMRAVEAAEGGVVELFEDGHLTHRWARGTLKAHTGLRVPLDGSLAGACFLSRRPVLCDDALIDSRTTPDLARRLGTRSCLLVPVSRSRTVVGILKLQSSAVAAFSERDLQVVRLFAGAAAAGFADANAAASRRAARTAEDRYRAVFDSAIDFAIIVMDLNGMITDWNEGAVRILGWDRDEIVGKSADLFFTPADVVEGVPRREMRSALIDGRGSDERWHIRKDGQLFWANGEMMTLRADDGKSMGFLKILRDQTAQHEAEERLMGSERKLRLQRGLLEAVVQQAPIGIKIAFADGGPPLVNARMLAMTEAPAGARPHGERRSRRRDLLDDALTGALRRGEVLSNELVRREDPHTGDRRHWTLSSVPVVGDGDTVLAAVTVAVDVEDQRRALQALQVSEERLALAFEGSDSLGWWDWDIQRDLVFASAGFARLCGLDPAGAANGFATASFFDSIHPDDRGRVRSRVESALSGGGEFGEEFRVQGTDLPVWIFARGRCYLDGEGKAVRFPGVTIDITARKGIEAAAHARQVELRTLIEAVPVGIVLAEAPSGRITMVNRRVAEILGHPLDLSADRLAHRDDIARHVDGRLVDDHEWPLVRIASGACDRAQLELRYRRPGGRQVWIEISGEAVKDADGRTTGAVAAIVDIEDRKQAEANQTILNHELSHRMKNMLAMVHAVATQTLRNASGLAEARDALDSRLIALGKAHDILLGGDAESASVSSVVASALDMHDDRQGRFAITGPDLDISSTAALTLALIIHELATNAVKYGALSLESGRVGVEWKVQPGSQGPSFELTWSEAGGPPVVAPSRKGFGSRLIERGFGTARGCEVTLAYRPDGVLCSLTVPLARFQATDEKIDGIAGTASHQHEAMAR